MLMTTSPVSRSSRKNGAYARFAVQRSPATASAGMSSVAATTGAANRSGSTLVKYGTGSGP